MSISKQIEQEYKVLDDSAHWLVKVSTKAMEDLDSSEEEYLMSPTPENRQKIEAAMKTLEIYLARANKELEICDKFYNKYKQYIDKDAQED